jgi:predicted DNA-binding transcriptional regulator YafY
MNRIERISAILIQLQSKKIVKAQEIADRFEISLRTVYRDVRALEETGVPIIGEAGVGYSLVDGYRLPPIMFTKEEAMAFVTGEKLIEKFTDSSTQTSYKSALYKIKAVLKTTEKTHIDSLSDHIEIVQNRPFLVKNNTAHLEPILKSISEKKRLQINYFTNHSQENTERVIEPIGIFHNGNNWYLLGFCMLRNDYRNFKIERINSINVLDHYFEKQHPSLKSFLERTTIERELTKVVINVEKHVLRYFGEEMYYQGFVSQRNLGNKIVEMTFLTASLTGFSRWFMYYGEYAEIVEPIKLIEMVIENIGKLSKKFIKEVLV